MEREVRRLIGQVEEERRVVVLRLVMLEEFDRVVRRGVGRVKLAGAIRDCGYFRRLENIDLRIPKAAAATLISI